MKKILVIKHLAQESLGCIKDVLTRADLRLRYVNFHRDPNLTVNPERYDGIIILGGWMGAYEHERFPHLKHECELIEAALKQDKPILGICLGAQILAHTLGAKVAPMPEKELGWQKVNFHESILSDPLFSEFSRNETLFQMHGDYFSLPYQSIAMGSSKHCQGQAFRYQKNAYGLQFHLEINQKNLDEIFNNKEAVAYFGGEENIQKVKSDSALYLERSQNLCKKLTNAFLGNLGLCVNQSKKIGHGKNH